MATAQLREVDGVLMLPLSLEAKSRLSLTADSSVQVEVDGTDLIVRTGKAPRIRRSRYKLSELLADYDKMPRDTEQDHEWLNFPAAGRELL